MNKNTLSFSIRLATVKQFRSYYDLSSRFHIKGYVENSDFSCDMHFFNDIIIHCPIKELNLVLTDYQPEEISDLMDYLRNEDILNDISESAFPEKAA